MSDATHLVQPEAAPPSDWAEDRAEAIKLMLTALSLLDHNGGGVAAATLALAIDQLGGTAPVPPILIG